MSGLSVDVRWLHDHQGITRWGTEVVERLPYHYAPLRPAVTPASPADVLWLGNALRRYDVHLSPGYNAGLRLARRSARQLLVLHDLIHLDVAEESSPAKRLYYQRVVKPAVRQANRVVTVSEFSRRRIAEWSGLAADRIVVAPGAAAQSLVTAPTSPAPPADRPYALFVGNGKPHKRAGVAVQAVLADPAATHDLVVVGSLSGVDAEVLDLVDRNPGRVRVVAGVDDAELAGLYRHAACLLFPSSYEGFGLPAVEALHLGVPVVHCSEAVHDIVGDLGVAVPVAEGASGLHAGMVAAERLPERPGWRVDCAVRAEAFSWDTCAGSVADALAELL